MKIFARMGEEIGGVREVLEIVHAEDAAELHERYHADIAGQFVEAPAEVGEGFRFDGEEWLPPASPEEEPEPEPVWRTRLTRPEFKLQFTSAERIAIRAARDYAGEDGSQLMVKAVLDDFFDIVEDPALTFVDLQLPATIEGVEFLETAGLLTEARVDELLAGLPETM